MSLDSDKPVSLFKFYTFNEHSLSSLINSKIWISSAALLNDPFDCNISLSEKISSTDFRNYEKEQSFTVDGPIRERKRAWLGGLKEEYRLFRERIGVFCGSSCYKNNLMWSHYADSHKGFCVEIMVDDKFRDAEFSHGMNYMNVIYGSYPSESYWNVFGSHAKPDNIARLITLFSYKSKDWEYESEWRIFVLLEEGEKGRLEPMPGEIVSVKFGMNMPEANQKTIVQLLGKDISYEMAKKAAGGFDLDFASVEYG